MSTENSPKSKQKEAGIAPRGNKSLGAKPETKPADKQPKENSSKITRLERLKQGIENLRDGQQKQTGEGDKMSTSVGSVKSSELASIVRY